MILQITLLPCDLLIGYLYQQCMFLRVLGLFYGVMGVLCFPCESAGVGHVQSGGLRIAPVQSWTQTLGYVCVCIPSWVRQLLLFTINILTYCTLFDLLL